MNEGGNDKSDNTEGNQLFKIGFYFSPEEYVRRAMRLEHPASQFHLVPDSLRMNIFPLVTKGPHAMAMRRISYLQHMLEWKKRLLEDERMLRKTLPRHVNEVTAGKPLKLFRHLLEESNFPDMQGCDIMEQGVPLTGVEPESPLYLKKHRPAQVTTQQLDHQARWRRRAMTGRAVVLVVQLVSRHSCVADRLPVVVLIPRWSASKTQDRRPAERQRARTKKCHDWQGYD